MIYPSVSHWFSELLPAAIESVEYRDWLPFGVRVDVLRDDVRGGHLAGNKARKLKYPLLDAQRKGIRQLISMGGAYSNHLHALACAGALFGFRALGLIRGTRPVVLSPTLQDCLTWGMQLQFVAHDRYRQLRSMNAFEALQFAQRENGGNFTAKDSIWLPEGGSATSAITGVVELAREIPANYDVVMLAAGTGATAAGIAAGLSSGEVWAVPVLKPGAHLRVNARRMLAEAGFKPTRPIRWLTRFHHGGYAKVPCALQAFCDRFSKNTSVQIEPVYTGKVFYALEQLLKEGRIRAGQKVLVIHTGGLQGARS